MYKTFVRSQVRAAFRALSEADFDHVVRRFGDDGRIQLMGDHALGGEQVGREEIGRWFARVHELVPDLKLEPETIIVEGFPWNIRVATRFRVTATLAGGDRYENHGMQFLRLRGPRIVEDRLYEDTQSLAAMIERQQAALDAREQAPRGAPA